MDAIEHPDGWGVTKFIEGAPAPQGSKRAIVNRHTGKPALIESSKARVQEWRKAVVHHVQGLVDKPVALPVTVTIHFILPRPKAHWRTGRFADLLRDKAPRHHTRPPDVDKLVRSTLDGFVQAGLLEDDAYVVGLRVTKGWAPRRDYRTGALVTVEEVRA